MQAIIYARLLGRFGGFHSGGLRHGNVFGLHLLAVLFMIAATVLGAAGATTLVSSWVAKRSANQDSIKAAAWITFIVVFAALGWITLRLTRS